MLESIIGSKNRELILIYLAARKQGYAREIAAFYKKSLSPLQNQLDRLENGNILVSILLLDLLKKAISFLPKERQDELLLIRKRPRRKDKPL
jgi:hypothetical protein